MSSTRAALQREELHVTSPSVQAGQLLAPDAEGAALEAKAFRSGLLAARCPCGAGGRRKK